MTKTKTKTKTKPASAVVAEAPPLTKVWVLARGYEGDGFDVVGAYRTQALASAAATNHVLLFGTGPRARWTADAGILTWRPRGRDEVWTITELEVRP